MSESAEHDHEPGCRAVNFDETGRYTGTRAFDPERCATCRAEALA